PPEAGKPLAIQSGPARSPSRRGRRGAPRARLRRLTMAKAKRFCISVAALFTLAPAGLVHFAGSEVSYRFLKEIRIGGEGGWDYLSIDAAARRLYVSHANKVVVIDLD